METNEPPTTPPLFGHAPGLVCSRLVGDTACKEAAVVHVAWTPDLENGLACQEHRAELGAVWCYWQCHEYDPMCSIAGAVWVSDPDGNSRCEVADLATAADAGGCLASIGT